jgi:hypothetical protein
MGHLAGIIQGNPAYDRRVQLINGTPTFIGDTFTLALKVKGARQLSLARVGRQPLL